MFATLFTYPAILARHRTAPCAESREQFLMHYAEQGYLHSMLQKIAWILLVLSQDVDLCRSKRVTRQQIEFSVDHRARLIQRHQGIGHAPSSRQMFIHYAEAWFHFRGCLVEPQAVPRPFFAYLDEFVRYMRDERGLSPVTIATRYQQVTNFLEAIWRPGIALSAISVKDVDTYLAHQGNQGWSRASLHTLASTLRSFFRYAEGQKWCSAIAAAIEAPRLFAQEGVPLGPTWEEVQQLIASTVGDRAVDIRDHAILLLLAVYGLRRGEVARLRLDDVDWEGEILHVVRAKQRCTQHYPLVASVGNAILRYLKETRPRCAHRELFMTLHAPVRPLLPASITPIVHSRLAALGVSIPRRGAHCLRHACARHLLAGGFSFKQIGDQLGHRSASATLHYAKVDLDGLRQVAELDLRGVL
jgi:site-specific recombinase XerD